MGEVYRARDSKLHRDVAIKVLPAHLSENPDAVDDKKVRGLNPPPPWPVGYISAVAWSSPTELLYSQAESVAGDIAGGTARIILQDVRSRAARPLLWSPNNGLVLDLLGTGSLVFDARSPRENLQEIRSSVPRLP